MTTKDSSPLPGPFPSEMPVGAIPVLSTVLTDEAVSQALRDALDKLEQDKLDWTALEGQILQTLRPEMERLTAELVQKTLREVWLQRSQLKY
jgi:hypothetical protein